MEFLRMAVVALLIGIFAGVGIRVSAWFVPNPPAKITVCNSADRENDPQCRELAEVAKELAKPAAKTK